MKVLLLDPMPAETIAEFTKLNYNVTEDFDPKTEGQLANLVQDFNIICLSRDSDETILTDEVLRSAHRLLAIGMFGFLKNQIDIPTAVAMGIPIFTSPYQHQTAVAELVISFVVLLARQIGDRSMEMHTGNWQKTSNDCHEVRGKTLGIIGYGNVGSSLGIMAEALSMKVVFYDVLANMPIGRAEPRTSIEQVLQESDFVSINVSSRPENVGLIGTKQLQMMKPKSYLINCSFGEAVDLAALKDALEKKHLTGAALDVFPAALEPKSKNGTLEHPLKGLQNVILTPHYGKRTHEAAKRAAAEIQRSLCKFVEDGSTLGCVNFPSIVGPPLSRGCSRILCLHHNVRGVVREIQNILSGYNVNHQILDTMDKVGILMVDVATESVSTEIVKEMASLANAIRTRIIN